jgi:Uma2 family endonuclease
MATTKLWTVDDVAQLPDDGFRYVLIRGMLFRMSPPMGPHGLIANEAGRRIGNFVKERNLGAVYNQSGFILGHDPDVLLEPDVAFVQRARFPENPRGYPAMAPDLVVEITSPSQSGPSIKEKTALYLDAGVRLMWIIDPIRRAVRVRRPDGTDRLLSEQDELDGEDVLPGFRLPISALFD